MIANNFYSFLNQEFRNDFYAELSKWLSRHVFSQILVLASSFDHYLIPDMNRLSPFPIKYIASNLDESVQSFLESKLKMNAVERVDPYTMKPDLNGRIHLPGSGSARAYLKSFTTVLKDSTKTQLICFVMFCSEGDNRAHATAYADKVAHFLNRNEPVLRFGQKKVDQQSDFDWITPFSWRTLFGQDAQGKCSSQRSVKAE